MRSSALSFLFILVLAAPVQGDNNQRFYFKHGNNLHKRGDRLTPHWCKKLVNAGASDQIRLDEEGAAKERLLQRAWLKVGAPKGLPSRLDSVFVALNHMDWKGEMSSKPFIYAVKAPRGAKVTVRDSRYDTRCFGALQHHTRAKDPRTKRRWLAVAWRAAKDYWRKPGTAPGALPEVLIEGGATIYDTLNDPKVNAYINTLERCKVERLPRYPGTPTADEQKKAQQRPARRRSRAANPLLLNPFLGFWLR